MKYFGEASAFKQFTNGKGINFYPTDRGTWYGTSPDNRYIKKLGKNTKSEYVSVKFEELDSYLNSLPPNTRSNPYKINVTYLTDTNLMARGGYLNGYTKDTCSNLMSVIYKNKRFVSLMEYPGDIIGEIASLYPEIIDGEPGVYSINAFSSDLDYLMEKGNDPTVLKEVEYLVSVKGDFSNITDARGMFCYSIGIESISDLNLNGITNADYLFGVCSNLREINMDFTNIISANRMFYNCISLTKINTSTFKNLTNAEELFANCNKLTEIDTTPFTNVTNATSMFDGCTLTAYYSSEDDNLYKNYRDVVGGNVTWVKK